VAWNAIAAWSKGVSVSRTGLGKGGRVFPRGEGSAGGNATERRRHITSDPLPASAPGPIRKSGAAIVHGVAAMGGRSSRRWPKSAYVWGLKEADLA